MTSPSSAYLLPQGLQAVQEARPEVFEERPVDLLQAVFGASVNADVQLSDGFQAPEDGEKLQHSTWPVSGGETSHVVRPTDNICIYRCLYNMDGITEQNKTC